jgi:uncharacterized protein YggT (Ycf19 family)
MGLIDFVLNFVCLLLWLNWRSLRFGAAEQRRPVSLASTLKKAEGRRGSRWIPLAAVFALLLARAFFYWNVGSALNWTPSVQLGVISLHFRSDYLLRILLFSFLSFGLLLGGFYAWLLLISVVNSRVPSEDPGQRVVRMQLGWLERWPPLLKAMLPMLCCTLLWGLGSPWLVHIGLLPSPASLGHQWEQAFVLGLTSFLVWKFLILALCLLYLINSYVYLGNSSFWKYVNTTGANLLSPLRRLPVSFGKLDLAPFLGMGLVLLVTHWAGRWLPQLFQQLPL